MFLSKNENALSTGEEYVKILTVLASFNLCRDC